MSFQQSTQQAPIVCATCQAAPSIGTQGQGPPVCANCLTASNKRATVAPVPKMPKGVVNKIVFTITQAAALALGVAVTAVELYVGAGFKILDFFLNLANSGVQSVRSVRDRGRTIINLTASGVTVTIAEVRHRGNEALNTVTVSTAETASDIAQVASNTFNKSVEITGKAATVLGVQAQKAMNVAGDIGESAVQKGAQALQASKGVAGQMADSAMNVAGKAKDVGKDALQQTANVASDTAQSAKETAQDTADTVKDSAQYAQGQAAQAGTTGTQAGPTAQPTGARGVAAAPPAANVTVVTPSPGVVETQGVPRARTDSALDVTGGERDAPKAPRGVFGGLYNVARTT